MKYFLRRINGVNLYGQVVIATKINPGENLTDKVFYWRKISDLHGNVMEFEDLCQIHVVNFHHLLMTR